MKINIIIIIFFSSLLIGCESFLEVQPPSDRLISNTIFENNETAISSVTGLYAKMQQAAFPISYYIPFYAGLYGDELDYKQTDKGIQSVYLYALSAKEAPTNALWINSYNFIYQCNSIIEGLEKSSQVNAQVKNQLLGESLFIRAFWHFYLCNFYGDIPIAITTSYEINSRSIRMPIEEVYKQIIDDLIKAKSMLSVKYVAMNSVTESTERIRPNSMAASALLSRVYLYRKEWKNAEDEATLIINSPAFTMEAIDKAFKRTSREAIWQLELPAGTLNFNSYEGNYFTLIGKPNISSPYRSATLTSSLLSTFQETDLRKQKWIGTSIDQTVTPNVKYYYPGKYRSTTLQPADEYTTCFRLAEQYLIRAEARAQQDNLPAAINDSDRTRLRANLDLIKDINPNISKGALLDSISKERRRELFCEWGLRWFDIRRSTITQDIMAEIAKQKSIDWNNDFILWPIPLNEILNNRNLVQNNGYN